ncbi:NUT family member 2D-like [Elephas maximus indicus]|uniref:NUT family member 2D-like n=1 Tax=Elephas maximus indicus TaxID=99487 RepID=UPI002116D82F|nr:NUT family member 2D-like [Elephas maximus indicus]
MATPVLGPDTTMNPGASMSPFTVLPFPPHTPGPPQQTPWMHHPRPLMTSSCLPGTPLGLSAFPRTLLVPSTGNSGPCGARPAKVIFQVRTEGSSAELPGIQTFVMGQTPLNWSAPEAPSGAVEHAPPPYGEASAVIPATSVVATQACRGVWSPALSLQAPPPAAQLASIFPQVKACSGQHASSGEKSLAVTQSRPSLDDSSCNPQSVYQNYRRWQCFKSLARRHHPQSPDTEALSCFLIPVLRSLARLKPTMTLEEGLWRSVQEWQRKSNFDRMIFYEMAEKFMEFEAEEELQIQMLQQRNASVCLLPPAPRDLDPHGPSSTVAAQRPVFIPKKGVSMAQPPKQHRHRTKHPWEPKRSHEIPPEAVKEYVEIMEDLLGTAHSATVEPDGKYEEEENEQQQEEDELYPDPGLLSYIDKLCAQEGFITKVEAVIHPQFLEMLLSPESQVDPLSLRQELEEEEGLTLTQLVEKRLLELKGNVGVEASPTSGVPTSESRGTESGTSQDAGSTDNHNSQLQTSKKMSTKKLDADDLPKDGSGHSHPSTSKELALFTWSPMSQELKSAQSTSPQRRPSRTYPRLGNRGTLMSLEASPISETPGKGEGSSEEEKEEDELPSLDFLLASQESLLPWSLSKSPLSASSILHHGIRGTWGSSQLRCPETVSLRQPGHTAAKCKIPVQVRTPSLAAKRPYSGADLGVSGRQPLTVGEVQPSLPLKRKCDPSTHGKRKKHLLSQ